MYCKYCGKEVHDDSIFCKECGKSLGHNKVKVKSKKPIVVAGIVAISLLLIVYVIGVIIRGEVIGSIFEKYSYEAEYQCILQSWDYNDYDDAFVNRSGIATISKQGSRYLITAIRMGPELIADYNKNYDPSSSYNKIITDDNRVWTITLYNEPCSNDYKEQINSRDYTGNICASKNSNVYHNKRCGYVKSISSSNLIYFPNVAVADLMKYRSCERCGKWWDTK